MSILGRLKAVERKVERLAGLRGKKRTSKKRHARRTKSGKFAKR